MYDIERLLDNLHINQIELCNIIGITSPAMSKVRAGKMKFPKELTEIFKKSFNRAFNDIIREKRLTSKIQSTGQDLPNEPKIITTEEEINGFYIIKSILRTIIYRLLYCDIIICVFLL